MAKQTNISHYTDPHITHMDQKAQLEILQPVLTTQWTEPSNSHTVPPLDPSPEGSQVANRGTQRHASIPAANPSDRGTQRH